MSLSISDRLLGFQSNLLSYAAPSPSISQIIFFCSDYTKLIHQYFIIHKIKIALEENYINWSKKSTMMIKNIE